MCIIFLLTSCTQFENQPKISLENEEIFKYFTVKQTTNFIGLFSRFQTEKIVVEEKPNLISFNFKGLSTINLKAKDYSLSGLTFKIKNGNFYLDGNDSDYIFILEGMPKIYSSGKTSDLINGNPHLEISDVDMLIIGYLELTTPFEKRTDSRVDFKNHRIQCSFFGTYYLTSVNTSSSTTLAEIESAVSGGAYNSGCTKIGGVDVSCLFDSHICVATQAYCCD